MKYVIVIAENITQFQDYVKNAIMKGTFSNVDTIAYSDKIILAGVTFMYVYSEYQLRGYVLDKDSVLVKVGTWYKISAEIIENIEKVFTARKAIVIKK